MFLNLNSTEMSQPKRRNDLQRNINQKWKKKSDLVDLHFKAAGKQKSVVDFDSHRYWVKILPHKISLEL